MKTLGRHLIAEYAECARSVFHRYAPQGVSGVVVVAESHLSIHTWPEYGYAAVDFFTCGQTVDPFKAYEHLKGMLESREGTVQEITRGIPSEKDEVLRHKMESPSETVVAATR